MNPRPPVLVDEPPLPAVLPPLPVVLPPLPVVLPPVLVDPLAPPPAPGVPAGG
jgi:hypothetical protein